MKKYIFEKDKTMPLCVIIDDNYVDYFTGQIITSKSIIDFIRKGLKDKNMQEKEINLCIYCIQRYIMPTYDREIIAYNYRINGCDNYLSMNKQILDSVKVKYIAENLNKGIFFQELLWGDDSG